MSQQQKSQFDKEEEVSKELLIQLNKTCNDIFDNIIDLLLLFKNNDELKSTIYYTNIFGDNVVSTMLRKIKESKHFSNLDIEHYDVTKNMNINEKNAYYTRLVLYEALFNFQKVDKIELT